jgi:hypothetical protein
MIYFINETEGGRRGKFGKGKKGVGRGGDD